MTRKIKCISSRGKILKYTHIHAISYNTLFSVEPFLTNRQSFLPLQPNNKPVLNSIALKM